MAVALLAAYALYRVARRPARFSRLRNLHGDQCGAVQSLSFVLVLPLFVMVMLFIVQVSQLMIGTIVVHYSAYAAAICHMAGICTSAVAGAGHDNEFAIGSASVLRERTDCQI